MLFRYFYEAIVGAIAITLVLLFGMKGLASLALLAFLPLYLRARRVQPGERELTLFYKTGNLTLGIIIISVFVIYKFSQTSIHGQTVGDNWKGILMALIVFFHGMAGLFMNKFR
ncbi:MAG: hypothetical protein HF300_08095 [Ignavibacteria bacterium]|jgi:hypothetical protein|nr:hypothetical protein [Ignavibacteria bacterium]MCU7498591.1 hypothetical protein [Ignavibacteria bacterium]MCU7512505.1 hypothetical protein [Ignavibacteria bacterium]MCU7520898.1 hypothetical protein [Ignavibacteria bacterium]MCU7523576.1 hypothetical protein [Ignavibacteria bacterium]